MVRWKTVPATKRTKCCWMDGSHRTYVPVNIGRFNWRWIFSFHKISTTWKLFSTNRFGQWIVYAANLFVNDSKNDRKEQKKNNKFQIQILWCCDNICLRHLNVGNQILRIACVHFYIYIWTYISISIYCIFMFEVPVPKHIYIYTKLVVNIFIV